VSLGKAQGFFWSAAIYRSFRKTGMANGDRNRREKKQSGDKSPHSKKRSSWD